MKKSLISIAVVAAVAGVGGIAHAQFAKPELSIKYRQSALFIMSQHFGRIGAVVKGERPYNQAEVTQNAVLVREMSQIAFDGFGPGTDSGAPTRALPAIWKDTPKFQAAAKRLQEETAKLADAARSGDQAAIKTAFGAVGQACKNCHDDFRKD